MDDTGKLFLKLCKREKKASLPFTSYNLLLRPQFKKQNDQNSSDSLARALG